MSEQVRYLLVCVGITVAVWALSWLVRAIWGTT